MRNAGSVRSAFLTAIIISVAIVCAKNAIAGAEQPFFPFSPSLITLQLPSATFEGPEACRSCHQKQYDEWSGSAHALAFDDPLFQGELNRLFKTGGAQVRFCAGCHSPAGMVTGEVPKPGLKGLGTAARSGISCDICHSITSVTHDKTPGGEAENGSMVLSPGAGTRKGSRRETQGPFAPASGCGGGNHACKESALFLTSELCAPCHQVYQPDNHLPLETTYLEWKRSAYAQQGIQCQDCHMVETQVFLRTADTLTRPARSEYRHSFAGANFFLASLAADAARKRGDLAQAASFDKRAQEAMALLTAAADIELFPIYHNKKLAEVKVRVRNLRAGHDLPTASPNVREVWLQVTAHDAAGNVLLRSGTFEGPGMLGPETRIFNAEGMGDAYHGIRTAGTSVAYTRRDTIPARGYRDVHYVLAPAKRAGPVAIEARLFYRAADQKTVRKLLRDLPEDISIENVYGASTMTAVPVVEMASKKIAAPSAEK